MGKCWMFEETGEVRPPRWGEWFVNPYAFSNSEPILCKKEDEILSYRILSVTEYPSNPLLAIKEKLESITCLAAEGPEVENHAELFQAIAREALKAIEIMEGK